LALETREAAGFLDQLNGVHLNIQFTRNTKRDSHLTIMDTDIYRRWRSDGFLGCKAYHKPTLTNFYVSELWFPLAPI
jgi:hypothetical protein